MKNRTSSLMFMLGLLLFGTPLISNAAVGAPAWLEKTEVDKNIHVDQNNIQSSDSNPGSKELPLKTLSAGANLALKNHKRGFSTKILIYPGVYREKINMEFNERKDDPPFIFESKEPGKAIISGSDVWTDWEETSRKHVYVHSWPHRWGLKAYPPGWEGQVKLEAIVRRREMIIVDNSALNQVTSVSDLISGTFYVSEEEGRIFIAMPEGISPSNATIEVGIRSGLFFVRGKTNIILRGLKFQHDVSSIEGSAVTISKSNNVIIEDCFFILNNWTGYRFHDNRNVTSRRNVANYNGATGHTAWKVQNYLSEDDEVSFNNWRGKAGNFMYWAVSGSKYMRVHDAIFRRHLARGNHAAGFWLDSDNQDVFVEDSRWCGNLKHGLLIEASQGPITIQNTKIYNNLQWGIRGITSSNITLISNQIFHNRGQQILLQGPKERLIDDWETGIHKAVRMESWELKNNVIVGDNVVLFESDFLEYFLGSLKARDNIWYKNASKLAFRLGGRVLSFSEWQNTINGDSSSSFIDPATIGILFPKDCAY